MNYSYYIIYKPYMVLSQFTSTDGKQCLKDFFDVEKDVYPVGRLDYDSEGLLILTNDATLNHKLLHPKFVHERTYLAQADGMVTDEAVRLLCQGVTITVNGNPYLTKPCKVVRLDQPPVVPERNPPIRFRKNIPVSWINLTLMEGKNRQVRKMMAKVGFPTLRLIRTRIEEIRLGEMKPGEMIVLTRDVINRKLFGK